MTDNRSMRPSWTEILVPVNTVHVVTNHPPFGTHGILALDIVTNPYLTSPPPFYFILSILLYSFSAGKGFAVGGPVSSSPSG